MLVLCCNCLKAQQNHIQGVVMDSLGQAIGGVFISLNTPDDVGIAFTQTDSTGKFNIAYIDTTSILYLSAKALTYRSARQKIMPNKSFYTFTLNAKSEELPEVTVKSSRGIIQRGDTLKYNVKIFKRSQDKAIIDVIKRLPGIEVSENGVISFNGKTIKNVYVGGDNIVDSRYGLVTNNIPVDAVTQVQVLEHDQPIKALQNFTTTQDVSLNLKIADSAQIKSINIAQFGAGNKRYYGSFTNLLLKKDIKAINLLKVNNSGENLLTENTTQSITSSENPQNTIKAFDQYITLTSHKQPRLDSKYYLQNEDKMGSVNLLFHPKSDVSTRLNISNFQLKRKNEYNLLTRYELPGNMITYNENQVSTTRSQIWQADFQMEKNTTQGYLKSITTTHLPYEQLTAHTLSNGTNYEQSLHTPFFSISNQTNLIKVGKTKNIFQYRSTFQYYHTNERLRISPGPLSDILNDSIGYKTVQQKINTNNFFVNQSINYQKQKGNFFFSAVAGIRYLHNTFESSLATTDSALQMKKSGTKFQNDIQFDQLDIYTQLEAKFKLKGYQFKAKISPTFEQINYDLKPISENKVNHHYLMLSPSVSVDKDLGRNASIHANYFHQSSSGFINNIFQGSILTDYRSISANNAELPRINQNKFSLRYAYKNPLKLFFYNLFSSYVRTNKNTINSYIIDSGVTKQISISYKNVNPLLTIGGGLSKYLFFLKTNISGNLFYNIQSGLNYNNETITPFHLQNYTANITANKKLLKSGILSIKIIENIFKSKQSNIMKSILKSKFWKQDIIFTWQHDISENFQYQLFFTDCTTQQDLQSPSRNKFLDFSLLYNPFKWKGYFELKGLNLLNEKIYEELSLRSDGYSILQMPLRERMLLLKYTFNF